MFRILVDGLLDPQDPYLLVRDFEDYVRCQDEVSRAFCDKKSWWRKSILNVARIGSFPPTGLSGNMPKIFGG